MQLKQLFRSSAIALVVLAILLALASLAWVIELWRAQEFLKTQVELQATELDRELAQLSIQ